MYCCLPQHLWPGYLALGSYNTKHSTHNRNPDTGCRSYQQCSWLYYTFGSCTINAAWLSPGCTACGPRVVQHPHTPWQQVLQIECHAFMQHRLNHHILCSFTTEPPYMPVLFKAISVRVLMRRNPRPQLPYPKNCTMQGRVLLLAVTLLFKL